ncbi:hypothetical protein EMCRGX_G017067 [Ephydatia muelleri]
MARVPPGAVPNSMSFALGGLAGMTATVFVQPLDLEYKTSFHAFASIVKKEGIFGIYNGLSAGLLRQATYSTVRLGVFQSLTDKLSSSDRKPPGAIAKILMKISLNDSRWKASCRTKTRGCGPTVVRAIVVNAAQLATYSQSKQFLLSTSYFTDNVMCHFVASMISGLVTTIVSMPVDIAKTRVQNMKIVNGVPEYRGAVVITQHNQLIINTISIQRSTCRVEP